MIYVLRGYTRLTLGKLGFNEMTMTFTSPPSGGKDWVAQVPTKFNGTGPLNRAVTMPQNYLCSKAGQSDGGHTTFLASCQGAAQAFKLGG